MLDLFRTAAQVSARTESTALPGDILSFTLVYPEKPDLESERARLVELFGGDGFDLFPYSIEDDPELLILQFQGVSREQSAEFLFAAAQSLNDEISTLSVEPDVDAPYRDVTSVAPGTEGIGDVVWSLCQSNASGSTDAAWARKLIRVPEAEAAHGVSGAGILVGQPDTGVADHAELQSGIDRVRGYDFVSNRPDPIDPLSKKMSSPGHGTGTSSAVISRRSGHVTGSAKGATVVPIRVVNAVVFTSGTAIARGIDHARHQGCKVITMSLGGPFASSAMRRAIIRAINAGMIVLAAAGNCVGFVTFPAWDKYMIGVAGVDKNMRKWKGSCSGRAVDISAPGENVFVARRIVVPAGHTPTPAEKADVNARGQGTSYAVALTAGVAALWIEKWGQPAIIAEATRRGLTVQMFFRMALQVTAQVPNGWDARNMGAGIVDAKALLDRDLASLPNAPAQVESGNPALAEFDNDFDGTPFFTEASYIAFDRQVRQDPRHSGALETPFAPQPSPQLTATLKPTPLNDAPSPAAIIAPVSPPVSLEEAVKRLALSGDRTLESAASVSTESALEGLKAVGTTRILEQMEAALSQREAAAGNLVDRGVQAEALTRIARTVESLTNETDDPGVPDGERRATLEALVRLTGRPAVRVKGDGSEIRDHRLGNWASKLVGQRHKWQPLTQAVGRIDVKSATGEWVHAGTGFVTSEGKIMTNRHVIDTFVEAMPAPPGQQAFHTMRKASIIFDPEAEDETTRYALGQILTAGRSRIGSYVDLGKLDMAVVEMDTSNGHQPAPLPINTTRVSMTDPDLTDILLSGYPARPAGSSGPTSDSDDYLAFWDRLEELYGEEYGKQYLSPGIIMDRPGSVIGDAKQWAFTHDATTMPGNSGSAIISLHGAMDFCGLHFGGATLTQNYAHDIASCLAAGDGVFDIHVLG